METTTHYACPRCEYPLIPVHAREGIRRRIIALTCPEPYCDHMQLVTRQEARRIGRDLSRSDSETGLRRTAN
jgi:hypothetical protein